MKLKQFDITFDNPEKTYFAGQEISGKILLELEEAKQINEILLELKGRAKTYWSKHSGKSKTHCTQSEPYFCEQFNTKFTHSFEKKINAKNTERTIPKGIHEIPFSYTLPKNLPTSFEGDFGFVRYTCRAICERPWDFDIVSICPFTVVGIEDINQDNDALEPATASETNRKVSFCCRRQGIIHVELNLNRTGYTPGENIIVNAVINNETQKTLKASQAKLKQNVNYKAKTFLGVEYVKNVSKVVVKLDKGEIPPTSEFRWSNQVIQIPALPPRLSKCNIIDIKYCIELEVDTVTVQIPITIGTIPKISDIVGKLNSSAAERLFPIQLTVTDDTGNIMEPKEDAELLSEEAEALIMSKKRVRMPSSILSELYPTLPSPYYKESFFGLVDISEEKESVQVKV
uniref:Arrestin_C domain-containing protein n=1 Tax=Bursaphelenchus xylophilus TaxID=6326 RepID=A0A1I7ST33_BURXY